MDLLLTLTVVKRSDPFFDVSSWEAFDLTTINSNYIGFAAAAFDGQFVYFVGSESGVSPDYTYTGLVLRHDTTQTIGSDWNSFDITTIATLRCAPAQNTAFDQQRYLYITCGASPTILRYDTSGTFQDVSNWEAFNAATIPNWGCSSPGYLGIAFAGSFIYFSPLINCGMVLQYDTAQDFLNPPSWLAYNATIIDDLYTDGSSGAVYDGQRYVFFAPYVSSVGYSGVVLRYDTESNFLSTTSWVAYDASEGTI